MPYINQTRRREMALRAERPQTAGELNYVITSLIRDYLLDRGKNYQTMNDIVGALDNAKSEFKRRIQDPYEDAKIKENGDVYV